MKRRFTLMGIWLVLVIGESYGTEHQYKIETRTKRLTFIKWTRTPLYFLIPTPQTTPNHQLLDFSTTQPLLMQLRIINHPHTQAHAHTFTIVTSGDGRRERGNNKHQTKYCLTIYGFEYIVERRTRAEDRTIYKSDLIGTNQFGLLSCLVLGFETGLRSSS